MLRTYDRRHFSAKNKRKRAEKRAKQWKLQKEKQLWPVEEEKNDVVHELLCRRYQSIHDNNLTLTHHACQRMAQRNISVEELFDPNVRTVVAEKSIVTTYRTMPKSHKSQVTTTK